MSHGWTNLSDKLILRSLIYAQFRIALTANAKNNWPRGQMLSIWVVKLGKFFPFPTAGLPANPGPALRVICQGRAVRIDGSHFHLKFAEKIGGDFLPLLGEAID